MALPWLGSVTSGRRGGVWPHWWPVHPLWIPRALTPHLEVTDVGPKADPAHVLQQHIQGVPCPACHMQRCLSIPLQRPSVLLQPQGQCCHPIPRSHSPKHCQQPASLASCFLPALSQPGLPSATKSGKFRPESYPTRAQCGSQHTGMAQAHCRQVPQPSRAPRRDRASPTASPAAASHSHGHRRCGEEHSVWLGPGGPGAAVCGTVQSRGPAGHSKVA